MKLVNMFYLCEGTYITHPNVVTSSLIDHMIQCCGKMASTSGIVDWFIHFWARADIMCPVFGSATGLYLALYSVSQSDIPFILASNWLCSHLWVRKSLSSSISSLLFFF